MQWLERLAELRSTGRSCVLVVVTDVVGSAPREVGARMLVVDGRLDQGTIGGGNLEHEAIAHANALLAGDTRSETVAYPLAEKLGQCCGGKVTLFYEAFRWTRPTVAVFGAGHVGQAVAGLAPWLGSRVLLIDGRDEDELAPPVPIERPYELITVDAPEAELDRLPADALILIMTHSHALDQQILERALKRGTFPYIGLIGSERKWKRFRTRLVRKGFAAEEVDRVKCPVGVTRASKEPGAIALSIGAQLIEQRQLLAPRGQVAPTLRPETNS